MDQSLTSFIKQTSATEAVEAIAAADAVKPQPAIFKLNVDCFVKIFDYLSIVELLNMAQTCKLMQNVAGFIFQLHYPFAVGVVDDGNLFLRNHDEVQHNVNIFREYIKLVIFAFGSTRYDISHWHLKSVKIAQFHYARLKEARIQMMNDMLRNAEVVQLTACQFDDGTFECLLNKCEKLKFLAINFWPAYNCGVNWLHQKYPSLEQVAILPILKGCRQIQELAIFFKQNPNVRKFLTSSKFLSDNKAFIMDAKFDELKIIVDDLNFEAFFQLLKELHGKGIYKRFHIGFFEYFDMKQRFIDLLSSVNGLIAIRVPFNADNVDLNSLVNVEYLRFDCKINQIINMEQLAQNMVNLKLISFYKASIDDILPFVYQLPKLKKVAVEKTDDFHRVINIWAVNKNREKLHETAAHVSKVTIYIPECAYLFTRSRSITMSERLVEIQRYDVFDFTPIQMMSKKM